MWLISYIDKNYLNLLLSKKECSSEVYASLDIFEDRINVFLGKIKYTLGTNKIIIKYDKKSYSLYFLSNDIEQKYKNFLMKKRTIIWYLKYRLKKYQVIPRLIFKTSDINNLIYILSYMNKKGYKLNFSKNCLFLKDKLAC